MTPLSHGFEEHEVLRSRDGSTLVISRYWVVAESELANPDDDAIEAAKAAHTDRVSGILATGGSVAWDDASTPPNSLR